MMHIVADQDVTLLYKRPYPIQALIPVEANIGVAAHWDIIPPFDSTQPHLEQKIQPSQKQTFQLPRDMRT